MTVRLYEALQSKTAKPGVSACEGLCAHPMAWVVSIHLPKIETWCWSLCAPLSGETILPLKAQEQRRKSRRGGRANSPSLPMSFQPCANLSLGTGCSAKAKGKGSPEGGFKGEGQKQDKSRASQVTPGRSQRPAVRAAFRAFTGRNRDSGSNLKGLAGVHFWGHFRGGNHALASAFPRALLFQRFEAGSTVAPGHFLA